ncbi:hypothetical protein J4E80_008808 [Alternaria sp. BMP 0032]|nr:hypothetical protein J4E80_008808 [Alternaria sp. BMP 0032]
MCIALGAERKYGKASKLENIFWDKILEKTGTIQSHFTAGSTKPTHPDDANQRSVAWVLEKTGKNERGKGGDKGQKKNEGKAKEKNERKADKNEGKAEKNDGKVKEKNKEKAEKKNDGNTAKKGERNTEKKGEDANEKKSEEKSEKKGEEKRKKNHEDILTIVEDETTEWENDIIFEWTKKAQKLVKKDVHNIFQEGVELHGMTVGHLVRGLKNAGNIPSLTVEQLRRKDKDLTVEKACKIIIDQAWECSLEHFLRENKNQGTCKAAKRVHYIPPKNVVVGFRKRSSSEGPTPTGTMVGSDERNEPRRRSFDPSRDVESFEDQTIHSEAP